MEKYAREHWNSAVKPGYKWNQFWRDLSTGTYDVQGMFDQLRTNLERVEHTDRPTYVPVKQFVGIRSRSNEVASIYNNTFEKDRDRAIQYGPTRSLFTFFIPDKVRWYLDVMSDLEQVLDLGVEVYLPYLVGGGIYGIAAELRGETFQACDARSWDAIVLEVLGPYMQCFASHLHDAANLTSGQSWTSMIGTIGSLAIAEKLLKGTVVILGDNISIWNGKGKLSRLIKFEKEATELRSCLGLNFDKWPPAIRGIRLSQDRPDAMRSYPIARGVTGVAAFVRKPDSVTQKVYDLYFGKVDDEDLIDLIVGVPPADYSSPATMIQKQIGTEVM
jgi:hypothetical protein